MNTSVIPIDCYPKLSSLPTVTNIDLDVALSGSTLVYTENFSVSTTDPVLCGISYSLVYSANQSDYVLGSPLNVTYNSASNRLEVVDSLPGTTSLQIKITHGINHFNYSNIFSVNIECQPEVVNSASPCNINTIVVPVHKNG